MSTTLPISNKTNNYFIQTNHRVYFSHFSPFLLFLEIRCPPLERGVVHALRDAHDLALLLEVVARPLDDLPTPHRLAAAAPLLPLLARLAPLTRDRTPLAPVPLGRPPQGHRGIVICNVL